MQSHQWSSSTLCRDHLITATHHNPSRLSGLKRQSSASHRRGVREQSGARLQWIGALPRSSAKHFPIIKASFSLTYSFLEFHGVSNSYVADVDFKPSAPPPRCRSPTTAANHCGLGWEASSSLPPTAWLCSRVAIHQHGAQWSLNASLVSHVLTKNLKILPV